MFNKKRADIRDKGKTCFNFPDEGKTKELLTQGPLCFGESHEMSNARQFLLKLIKQDSVKKLFLEIPACSKQVQTFLSDSTTKIDGTEPQAVQDYLLHLNINTKGDNKEINWRNLIIFAKNKAVSVYCCDLPLFTSYDEFQGKSEYAFHTKKEEFHIDPDVYMDQLKSTTTPKHSRRYKRDVQSSIENNRSTGKGVMIRNQYAGKLIEQFTDNFSPLEMQNSILFGGMDHFQCPDNNNSLHTLCHIDQSKIIDFSSRDWIQKETNTQKPHANSADNNKLHTFFISLNQKENLSSGLAVFFLSEFINQIGIDNLKEWHQTRNDMQLTPIELAKTLDKLKPFITDLENAINDKLNTELASNKKFV